MLVTIHGFISKFPYTRNLPSTLFVQALYPLHESSPIVPVLLAAESDTKNELGMYNKTYQTSMRRQGDLLQAINPLQERLPIVPLLFSHTEGPVHCTEQRL